MDFTKTIIPLAQMASESIAHEAEGPFGLEDYLLMISKASEPPVRTRFATSFPGSLSHPSRDPWLGLVTCLPESGRLQTNDLGEGQIGVRFVSAERRDRSVESAAMKPLQPLQPLQPCHVILLMRLR